MQLSREFKQFITPCPNCKTSDFMVAQSCRGGEDTVDVWVECGKCGYDPTAERFGERVETVWGIEDWAILCAIETWNELLGEVNGQV